MVDLNRLSSCLTSMLLADLMCLLNLLPLGLVINNLLIVLKVVDDSDASDDVSDTSSNDINVIVDDTDDFSDDTIVDDSSDDVSDTSSNDINVIADDTDDFSDDTIVDDENNDKNDSKRVDSDVEINATLANIDDEKQDNGQDDGSSDDANNEHDLQDDEWQYETDWRVSLSSSPLIFEYFTRINLIRNNPTITEATVNPIDRPSTSLLIPADGFDGDGHGDSCSGLMISCSSKKFHSSSKNSFKVSFDILVVLLGFVILYE